MKQIAKSTFKKGSTTYFYSSMLFPKETKEEIATLYTFIQIGNNFVNQQEQDTIGLTAFTKHYRLALQGKPIGDVITDIFVELMREKHIEEDWVESFLWSMKQDTKKMTYKTLEETQHYMYGSAEVIGLMLARIMQLPEASYASARMLSKAMKYLHFIRDIPRYNELERQYIPREELKKHDLTTLTEKEAREKPIQFIRFIRDQLKHYHTWRKEAEKGYTYIPKRMLVPIKTAADMSLWTAKQLEKEPFSVFHKKTIPTPMRVLLQGIQNTMSTWN